MAVLLLDLAPSSLVLWTCVMSASVVGRCALAAHVAGQLTGKQQHGQALCMLTCVEESPAGGELSAAVSAGRRLHGRYMASAVLVCGALPPACRGLHLPEDAA